MFSYLLLLLHQLVSLKIQNCNLKGNWFVCSGSEDARAYLWDKHYKNNIAVYEHSWGVVNAVGFNPANQEYMVTVSDDNTIKIWRSRSEIRKLGPSFDTSQTAPVEADKCARKSWVCESTQAIQGTVETEEPFICDH